MAQVRSKPRGSRLSLPIKVIASILVVIIVLVIFVNPWGTASPSSSLVLVPSYKSEIVVPVVPAAPATTEDIPNFLKLGTKYGTDKVSGTLTQPSCNEDPKNCPRPDAINERCKVMGHFYDSMYQKWLGPLTNKKFQFLEIGFFRGSGFDAFSDMLPLAEKHSMEIACIEPGPREEGKWPWDNFAADNGNYESLVKANRLHCGDASDFQFLHHIWTTHMKRPDAPPLKVVVEDASHLSEHMATSVFFWLPRIAPGGILVVEDIESQTPANKFRTDLMPQLMMDLNYCGLPEETGNKLCFPTLQPFLKGISCELNICVLERNDYPAVEYDESKSMPPPNALDLMQCRSF